MSIVMARVSHIGLRGIRGSARGSDVVVNSIDIASLDRQRCHDLRMGAGS